MKLKINKSPNPLVEDIAEYEGSALAEMLEVLGIRIHPTAEVEDGVTFHPESVVENNAVIRNGAVIGRRASICKYARIYGAKIGTDCVVGRESEIFDGAEMDTNLTVKNNSKIGSGSHLGRGSAVGPYATIGNKVKIGSSTNIKFRSVLSEGVTIGAWCNIDHGVTIGRLACIGENSHVYSETSIGRSCVIGDNVEIWHNNRMQAFSKVEHEVIIGRGAAIQENSHIERTSDCITIGPVGSRKCTLTAYYHDGCCNVTTGCFTGTLVQFERAVQDTHGDNEFGVEYRLVIAFLQEKFKPIIKYHDEKNQAKRAAAAQAAGSVSEHQPGVIGS